MSVVLVDLLEGKSHQIIILFIILYIYIKYYNIVFLLFCTKPTHFKFQIRQHYILLLLYNINEVSSLTFQVISVEQVKAFAIE